MSKQIGQKIINNLANDLIDYEWSDGKIIKLGIQAAPGIKFQFNNNGNDIIMGRSGIYELEEDDYIISKIKFTDTENTKYPIIIDYIKEV